MILFAVYAAAVWYLACRWRRRWPGFAIPVIAATLAAALAGPLGSVGERTGLVPFRVLLFAEAALVGGIGLFIASLPRTRITGGLCFHCGYDLKGLAAAAHLCPECGTHFPPPRATPPSTPPAPARNPSA